MQTSEAVLVMFYWSLTTLSTIGLGDYYPVSDYERSLMCFVFLMGVAFFTYCSNVLVEIIKFIMDINKPRDYFIQTDFIRFMNVLKRFNKYEKQDEQFVHKMEDYFIYRWTNDKNWAFETSEDVRIFDELP